MEEAGDGEAGGGEDGGTNGSMGTVMPLPSITDELPSDAAMTQILAGMNPAFLANLASILGMGGVGCCGGGFRGWGGGGGRRREG
jgi:hypothetical protein